MTEVLAERKIRDRFVLTLPGVVRDILNLSVSDNIRFERNDNGDVCICKVRFHKVNNKSIGDSDAYISMDDKGA